MFANKEKCTFCVDSVIFLGFVVNKKGVHVDPTKIKAIQEWPTPKNVGEVRSFQGLASFYRRFVPQGSQRKLFVQETHEGGLMGHFGVEKTLGLLKEKFFWPHIRKDVQRHCNRSISCLQSIP